ncbi:MAG TPA: ELWxxDGT repeat protein [Acidimicrobiales bacterium]|nr:ELWxxDGT repeat protein [Acidimicrobiales bacterium]
MELWKSDGTAAGTSLVKDINPGSASSVYAGGEWPVAFNGKLYFAADDGVHGRELWVSDGTSDGTTMVKDIDPGASSSGPAIMQVAAGTIWFHADDGSVGAELWKSDGSTAGTSLVKDIAAGATSSGLGAFTAFAGKVYFGAAEPSHGEELWATDGTSDGTTMVKDINPGAGSGTGGLLHPLSSTLAVFAADDGVHGTELWKTDGTTNGTTMLKDINVPSTQVGGEEPGSDPSIGNASGGKTVFYANDGTNGPQPWVSDGTLPGTFALANIPQNPCCSSVAPSLIDGEWYWASPSDFWRTDGTVAGTKSTPTAAGTWGVQFQKLNGLILASASQALWRIGTPPLVVTTGNGAPVQLATFARNGSEMERTAPYGDFGGGASVAQGDVNGDGVLDIIVGAGPGGGPHVQVFSGVDNSVLRSFYAYASGFTGGVFVAAGDINGDGKADIITGVGPGGGPHVQAFSGADNTVLRSFYAYAPAFTGGVRVGAADINGDGKADIITGAGPGGGPHVQVFSGADNSVLRSFYAYAPGFTGGVYLGGGDINGDGKADIITGVGPGGGPHVQAFSGADNTVLRSFYAYAPAFTGGVRVGAADLNGDGKADIITGAGPGGGPHVQAFSGADNTVLDSFFAYPPSFTGGVFPASIGR